MDESQRQAAAERAAKAAELIKGHSGNFCIRGLVSETRCTYGVLEDIVTRLLTAGDIERACSVGGETFYRVRRRQPEEGGGP